MASIYRTIQIRLEPGGLERLALEFICERANSLVNCAVYAIRQGYFMVGGMGLVKANYPSLDTWMKEIENPHYRGIAAQASQQVLKGVVELTRVCRAALNLPKRYDLFSSLKKSYRKRCEARLQTA